MYSSPKEAKKERTETTVPRNPNKVWFSQKFIFNQFKKVVFFQKDNRNHILIIIGKTNKENIHPSTNVWTATTAPDRLSQVETHIYPPKPLQQAMQLMNRTITNTLDETKLTHTKIYNTPTI